MLFCMKLFSSGVSIYLDVYFLKLVGFLHINYKWGILNAMEDSLLKGKWRHVNHKIPARLQGG
jgi:hypothetical protein